MKTDHIERKPIRFRDDIDPATTWVVSDTHFGQNDDLSAFHRRPANHEDCMIEAWQECVGPEDTLLHLGDLNYSKNAMFKALTSKKLTGGRKLLVDGANHDRQRYSFYKHSGFQIVSPFKLKYNGLLGKSECPFCGGTGVIWPSTYCTCDGGYMTEPVKHVISFSHYPWNDEIEGGPIPENHLRVHGHIHNIGYTRDAYVPFLKGHVNLSVEQTRYSPVNLKLLLDAVLLGQYPETTDEQIEEARRRKAENLIEKGYA